MTWVATGYFPLIDSAPSWIVVDDVIQKKGPALNFSFPKQPYTCS